MQTASLSSAALVVAALAACAPMSPPPPATPVAAAPAAPPPMGGFTPGTGIYPAGPGATADAHAPPPMGPDGPNGRPRGPRPIDHVARGPSIDAAVRIARAAVASCKGFHVGVTVLDAEGGIKLSYIPDGTAGFHSYTGYRKALTAVRFGVPSEQAIKLAATDDAMRAKYAMDANYIGWAGGVPIKAGDEVIGAIGVSGAEPSEKDEACAMAGLSAARHFIK